jgi:cholesterol transport system auxiliary component
MMRTPPAFLIPTFVFVSLFMGGCAGLSGKQPEAAHFDFGPLRAAAVATVGVASIDVTAPSWLAGSGIQYRLAHVDATRRHEYGESRWAAPPGELLERALENRLAGTSEGRCRLHIELDEFIQAFDSATSSRWQLAARGTLQAGTMVLARRSFVASAPAASADAKGGVAAAAATVAELGDHLTEWIAQTPRCRQE